MAKSGCKIINVKNTFIQAKVWLSWHLCNKSQTIFIDFIRV